MTKNQFLNWEKVFKTEYFPSKLNFYFIFMENIQKNFPWNWFIWFQSFLAWTFLNFLARCVPSLMSFQNPKNEFRVPAPEDAGFFVTRIFGEMSTYAGTRNSFLGFGSSSKMGASKKRTFDFRVHLIICWCIRVPQPGFSGTQFHHF